MIQDRTQIQRDTVYLNSQRFDTVYVSHERTQDYRKAQLPTIGYRSDSVSPSLSSVDTVIIKDVSVEYRYRLLRDTVERVKLEVVCDSIPYPVEVEVIKQVPRQRTWYESLSLWITTSLLILLLFLTGSKLTKYLKVLFP